MTLDAFLTRKVFDSIRRRLFAWVAIVALVSSAICATGVLDGLNNTGFSTFMDRIVPCIGYVSDRTSIPETSRITFLIEWLFFPAYFALMCVYRMPLKVVRPESESARRNRRSRAVRVFPMTLILLWVILSDWNLIPGPSLYRGSVWEPDFALSQLPYFGPVGLAIAAFVTPVIEAFVYWVVPAIFVHFFVAPLLPIANKATTS
jgi:hypothetical protein